MSDFEVTPIDNSKDLLQSQIHFGINKLIAQVKQLRKTNNSDFLRYIADDLQNVRMAFDRVMDESKPEPLPEIKIAIDLNKLK